jgi:FlaA1/EpsC-like NDP-sugar epimerase
MSCQPHDAAQSMATTDKETGAIGSSNILECFQGAHVLVSGGTGFVGQVLMEKLLRNCQIGKLYVIVRPKKGLTEKERAEKIFGGVVSEYFVCDFSDGYNLYSRTGQAERYVRYSDRYEM